MKIIYHLFILLLNAHFVVAQKPCNDDVIMAVNGKWKKGSDANMTGQTALIITRIDKMQQQLQ